MYLPEVSWELGSRCPLPKTEKSSDLAHYFSGVAKFGYKKNQTSNVGGSMSGLNRIFTGEMSGLNRIFPGEIPQ